MMVVDSPPLLLSGKVEEVGEAVDEVEDMAGVVVVRVPLGAGKMVIVPHVTGPHGIFDIPRNPLATPVYSI
jgi:hypothetical protein